MKFRTTCQDHQAGKSTLKYLSQGHNRMARVGFERDHVDHLHGTLTIQPRCRQIIQIILSTKKIFCVGNYK